MEWTQWRLVHRLHHRRTIHRRTSLPHPRRHRAPYHDRKELGHHTNLDGKRLPQRSKQDLPQRSHRPHSGREGTQGFQVNKRTEDHKRNLQKPPRNIRSAKAMPVRGPPPAHLLPKSSAALIFWPQLPWLINASNSEPLSRFSTAACSWSRVPSSGTLARPTATLWIGNVACRCSIRSPLSPAIWSPCIGLVEPVLQGLLQINDTFNNGAGLFHELHIVFGSL